MTTMFDSSDGVMVGEQEFKHALRHFASGVTVITTQDETGAVHGMTATAFSSLSLAPPLILVAVATGSRCHALISDRRRFGVNVLYGHQSALSRQFGGKNQDDVAVTFQMLGETPVIAGTMVRLACRLDQAIPGGDHTIFVGRVEASQTEPGDPLVHFEGVYRRLAPASEKS